MLVVDEDDDDDTADGDGDNESGLAVVVVDENDDDDDDDVAESLPPLLLGKTESSSDFCLTITMPLDFSIFYGRKSKGKS